MEIESGLSTDSLRFAVSELLIKRIGEKLCIEPIKNFDKTLSSPRVYYLGINRITDRFHWIFINDLYKISAFDKLPEHIQKRLKAKGRQHTVRRKDAIKLLRDMPQKTLLVAPTLFLESPKEPQGYRITEETKDRILRGQAIDEESKKNIPTIYIDADKHEMADRDKIDRYDKKLGLSMMAYKEGALLFSPYAILDPRSCESGYWDVLLGIETTMYLPIELDDKRIGVLSISQDIGDADVPGWSLPPILKNLEDKIEMDKENLRIEAQYKYLTEDVAQTYQCNLRKQWEDIKTCDEIRSGVEVLHFLFETLVNCYNEYAFNFDDTIVKENLRTRNKELKKTLQGLASRERNPIHVITTHIDSLELATLKYLKSLRRLEPLLQNIGKREHYIHMFNVFLLGKVLWKRLFGKYPDHELWQDMALSHDITYPIEAIEDEIEEFFEVYFHNKKTPRFLVSQELFYSYGEFGRLLQELVKRTLKYLNFTAKQESIFEDLVLFNLYDRKDHAIISALFTAASLIREGKSERYVYKVVIPIFLHNLYQWKFYAYNEIEDFIREKPFRISPSMDNPVYKFEKSNFVSFVFERRFKDHLDKVTPKGKPRKAFAERLKKYKKGLSGIQIGVELSSSDFIKYTFILALADFWQEWGRITFTDKGMASVGVRISLPEENSRSMEIIVPFIAYSQFDYLYPADGMLNEWRSNPKYRIEPKKYFMDNTDDKEMKFSIREHVESTILQKDTKRAKEQAEKAVYKQNILKLWEYVYKFSSFTSLNGLKGTFKYEEALLSVIWRGIRDDEDIEKDFRWPKK